MGCSPEDKAVLEAVLERMLESERVESQNIRAGQKPYVRMASARRAQDS